MTVHNVTAYQLKQVVKSVNRDYDTSIVLRDLVEYKTGQNRDKVRIRFVFRLEDSGDTFHRRGQNHRRRMTNLCWHGSSIVFTRMFDLYPNAKLKSAFIGYSDREDFQRKFTSTGERTKGRGVGLELACDCGLDSEHYLRVMTELYPDPSAMYTEASVQ